jgi:hypothetical protein
MADFDNLPGIYVDLTDGNLQIVEANPAPVVTVLGTAEKGATGVLYPVVRPADAVNNFGSSGTLIRGMYEGRFGGSQNTVLMRIGASAAKVLYIGDSTSVAGITVESVDKDNTAGDDLYIYWDDTNRILRVFDAESTLVFEMENGVILTDTGRVYATGSATGGAGVPIPDGPEGYGGTLMSTIPATVDVSLRFDAGDDGTTPTYMKLYEAFDKAYRSLEAFDSDFVVPMGAYMDAPNVIDDATVLGSNTYDPTTPGAVTAVELEHSGVIETSLVVQVDPAGSGVYALPTMEWYLRPGTDGNVDQVIFHAALGASDEVRFVYEYLIRDSLLFYRSWEADGELMHEWSTTRWRGAWEGGNFVTYEYAEANFAWQCANYCYNLTKNDNDCVGMIGVMPFRSTALKDIADWAGFLPTFSTAGLVTVSGGGLAGNKWMAGKLVTAFDYTELSAAENFGPSVSAQAEYDLAQSNVVPGSVVVFVDGAQNYDWTLSAATGTLGVDEIIFSDEMVVIFAAGGNVLTAWYIYDDGGSAAQFGPGFWATAEETPDGTHVSPATDIGRHLSVVSSWPILFTPVDTTGFGYVATGAPVYAGFVSQLAPQSAPTNKVVPDIQMPFRMSKTRANDLVGVHYTVFAARERGTIVVDAPTAATATSDYQRLTTIRIVNECVQRVRRTLEPFIGEGLSTPQMEAMQTSTDRVLTDTIKDGLIQRFEASVTATAIERVQGKANVELLLVPAFELRQIYVTISLSAV